MKSHRSQALIETGTHLLTDGTLRLSQAHTPCLFFIVKCKEVSEKEGKPYQHYLASLINRCRGCSPSSTHNV